MRLDRLVLDLRPRPNAQALDLGFALLRSRALHTYLAWLGLWLPLIGLCAAIAFAAPGHAGWLILVPWWLRPILERAPLYVLSRHVFGESVSWRQALRAWPKQLRGGSLRLITWWRPFAAGRGLYQPIWQLEGARGSAAAARRTIMRRGNAGRSAFWFGIVCAHFEAVLQIGLVAFVGTFLSDDTKLNPFAYLFGDQNIAESPIYTGAMFIGYAFAGAIIGPIYTACCFTLYLNRRATLEAWDLEISLRQLKAPPGKRSGKALAALCALPLVLGLALAPARPVEAAAELDKCEEPAWIVRDRPPASTARSVEQARLRTQLKQLYRSNDVRLYRCKAVWRLKDWRKNENKKEKKRPDSSVLEQLPWLARIVKIALITAAVGFVLWLLYRYRGSFEKILKNRRARAATEVAGLDIRPETLPEDVPGRVRALWADHKRREALALLYRATLARLVSDDGLHIGKGATEGDCLRLAGLARDRRELRPERLEIITRTTGLWREAAYGNRWPTDDAVTGACSAWALEFGGRGERS